MGTNKERIKHLESGLGTVQEGLQRMEEALTRLSNVLLTNPESSNHGHHHRDNQEGGRPIVSSKSAKLEFPRFSGEDPTEWFNRVEQFFEYQGTAENQKVFMAAYHLEGEANQWWQWLRRTLQEDGRAIPWEQFEEELWARFGPSGCEDFDEALSRIRQLGTLRDYQREFEKLGNTMRGWTQKALVGTFMKAEISDGVRMFKPQSLKEAINLALMRDEQLTRQRRFMRPPPTRVPLALPQTNRVASVTSSTPFRHLSWDEMQKRRVQGLCFNCNERFTTGHKCQKPQLLLLEGYADAGNVICEDITDQHTVEIDQGGDTGEVQEPELEPEIMLHALTGWTTPRTMRITATMGSREVMVLIDSGSMHNFISDRLANSLRLPVVPTEPFIVRVANGEQLTCQGRFNEVLVNLQGIEFYLTLFSLPLSGLDLVLGIQWLEMLGSVVCNWKKLTMDFNWNKQARRLQGLDEQAVQEATLKEMSKECRMGHTLFALCIPSTTKNNLQGEFSEVKHQDLQRVIQEYEDVFQDPSCVPPMREVDHCITLKEGTEPINVRPTDMPIFRRKKLKGRSKRCWIPGIFVLAPVHFLCRYFS
ncbi:uncharacterized protein LOC121242288 [Juglans microcarpa x Juglans regia]|uniref:uncharacterized protein LOC121242288 n=1 Tax=Juglans microcarpa x Juglans regia TaxID=2249226 RepID=UPI001B7ED322|nr:uncharacterized protein LOC121242288 [Juglans microcarpa x Juglans regia]